MIQTLNEYLDKDGEFSNLVALLNNSIQKKDNNITILEKAIIVLMVTKLEVFLENKTSEWFNYLKQDEINTSNNLSSTIKQEIIMSTISDVYEELRNGKISNKNKSKLNNFNILTDDFYPLSKLDIEFKMTLNSHGSKEISKLLKKIGIEDVFSLMEQYEEKKNTEELLGDISLTVQFDYKGNIDKLVKYRNMIIHEDNLSSISYSDLNEFINSVNLLSVVVDDSVNKVYIESEELEVVNS